MVLCCLHQVVSGWMLQTATSCRRYPVAGDGPALPCRCMLPGRRRAPAVKAAVARLAVSS